MALRIAALIACVALAFAQQSGTGCEFSNEGKIYYITFMRNFADAPRNIPIEIFVTTAAPSATVTVEATGFNEQKRVTKNDITMFSINREIVAFPTPEERGIQRGRFGIRITASEKIVVYGVNKETFTADAYLALPENVVGQRYYTVSWYPPTYFTELAITPNRDQTSIEITLPRNEGPACAIDHEGRSYGNGDTFRVTLDTLESYQVQAKCDLTGTFVSSDKPISVFSGNARTVVDRGVTRDHLTEQIPPVSAWGLTFATHPIPLRTSGDYWKIVASDDDTEVSISGRNVNEERRTLQAGRHWLVDLSSDSYAFIRASKPVLVAQFVKSQREGGEDADPAMILNTPIEQFGLGYTFSTVEGVATTYKNLMMIVVEEGRQEALRIDGRQLQIESPGWVNIPGSGTVGGFMLLQSGAHNIDSASGDVRFATYIYGAGDRESYGFPTGMCLKVITCSATFMQISDGRDNDCDGQIDEEFCDNADNDGDGQVDEDCGEGRPQTVETPIDIKHTIGCYNDRAELQCPQGSAIRIVSAHWGRVSYVGEFTCHVGNELDCNGREVQCGYKDVQPQFSKLCDNQRSCVVTTNEHSLGSSCNESPCKTCSLYADVYYSCVEDSRLRCWFQSTRVASYMPAHFTASSSAVHPAVPGTCGKGTQAGCCADTKSVADSGLSAPFFAQFVMDNEMAWCAAHCDKKLPFLQIDLGADFLVSGFLLQGRRTHDHYVTRVTLAYSHDGETWYDVAPGQQPKIFSANIDSRTISGWHLNSLSFLARYIRFIAVDHNGYPCMHIEVLRCDEPVTCPALDIPHSNANAKTGAIDQVLTVMCDEAFRTREGERKFQMLCELPGSQNNNPTWVGGKRCDQPISCGAIPAVQNALHNGRNTKLGTEVRYTCDQGYQILGTEAIRCTAEGVWSTPPACCRQEEIDQEICYKISTERASFVDASDSCDNVGGRLAEPSRDQLEQGRDFLRRLAPRVTKMWVGYNDREIEGRWVKTSDGSQVQPLWAERSPDGTGYENCALAREDRAWRLDDAFCAEKHHYVCEHNRRR